MKKLIFALFIFTLPLLGETIRLKAGADFFRDQMGNQLDYDDDFDRRYDGADDIDMSGASLNNGAYEFTTSGTDSQIQLLNASIPSSVPLEFSGDHFPIDTSIYTKISMLISSDNAPDVDLFEVLPSDGIQANIQWYKDKQQNSENSATSPFFIYPGTHLYTFDLSSIGMVKSDGGSWDGIIKGLRFDPSNKSGYDFKIHWVTLSTPNSAVANFDWSGLPNAKGLAISDTNDESDLVPLLSTTAAVEQRYHLVPASESADISNVDVSFLAPGDYYIFPLDISGDVITGQGKTLSINAAPEFNISSPNKYGDVAKDFALVTRDGDTWDFSQGSDFSTEELIENEYGQGTISSNPSTSTAGTLSGDWIYHNNNGVVKPEDPNFRLSHVATIDSSYYKNITIKILLDRERDIGEGSVMRVFWSDLSIVDDLTRLMTSEDIIVQNGVNEITLDLSEVPMEADDDGTGREPWDDVPSINFLRIDPHEFPSETNTYIDSVTLTPYHQVDANGQFDITWTASDDDSDTVTVTIKLDPDDDPSNANEYTLTTDAVNSGTYSYDRANFPGVPDALYKVLFEFDDTYNAQSFYAGGKLNTALPEDNISDLSIQQVGEGAVTPATGVHGLTEGVAQAISAYPDTASGYDFVNWTVSGSATIADTTSEATSVTLSGDATISANFAIRKPMYRVYSSSLDYHFFCKSLVEYQNAVNVHLYNDESDNGSSPAYFILTENIGNSIGIHRLYNPNAGRHFYTTNSVEKDFLVTLGWNYEGIEAYMFSEQEVGTQEVFKLYNPNSGVHLYTINEAEKNYILANISGWEQHSSLGYAYPSAGSSINE